MKKKIIILFFLIFSNHFFGQCSIKDSYTLDLSNSEILRNFTKVNEQGQDAWYTLFKANELGQTTNLKALEYVLNYLKISNKTAEVVVEEIFNSGGYVKWVEKLGNAGGLFKNYTNLKNLSPDAKSFLSKNNWDNSLLSKLDNDLANSSLKDAFNAKPSLVNGWKVLDDAKVDDVIRGNINELAKVSDNLPSIKKVGSYQEWRKMDDLFKSRKTPDLATLRKMSQKYLDFTTKADGAVFWSGPRMGDAQKWARNNSRNTLEQTIGGEYLDELSLFSPSSGISGSEAAEIWDIASKTFAEKASGTVNVFSTGAKEVGDFGQRTWWRIEKPALLKNSKVIRIIRRNKDGSISKTGHIDVNPK